MLDETGAKTFFDWVHNSYIQPELDKRFGTAGKPDGFQIRQCLVRLPTAQPPIVEFNDEVGWEIANPILGPGVTMEAHKPIYLHDIVSFDCVLPPTVEGQRVAFIYLYWTGFEYSCHFDFLPNQPDYNPHEERFKFNDRIIVQYLKNRMVEMTVQLSSNAQEELRKIGLWTVTSLLPYPLTKIIALVGADQLEDATRLLVSHCNPGFIADLVETWKPIAVFDARIDAFRDAVFCHQNRRFYASIYTLISQIEGVLTDWLYPIVKPKVSLRAWPLKDRIKDFELEMSKVPQFEFRYKQALTSTIEFLNEGQPLQNFWNWLDVIDPNFPARHPLAHGKFVKEMFDEEKSIKLFLLLDTICQFMMFYEVRVLGRNLGDKSNP